MRKRQTIYSLFILFASFYPRLSYSTPPLSKSKSLNSPLPHGGIIIDSSTAIKLAEIILPTIYGEGVLKERPFKASLSGDVWTIEGRLQGAPYALGGVAYIKIRKSDAKVLAVGHGK